MQNKLSSTLHPKLAVRQTNLSLEKPIHETCSEDHFNPFFPRRVSKRPPCPANTDMTLRQSLGTRGELRRIAAEAEAATIDRVRPWRKTIQPCRLAPHVIVPRWIRLDAPTPPTESRLKMSEAEMVVKDTIDALLEAACAKKVERGFRRGRGRRRLRKDPDPSDELNATDSMDVEDTAPSTRGSSTMDISAIQPAMS